MRSELARFGAIGVFLAAATACPGECPRGDGDEPDEVCDNGRDDDGDGAADCDDDDCGCPPEDCTNGFDDDSDGDADCADDGCELDEACIEDDCADGRDDDGDGDADCDDPDCASSCPWEPASYGVEGGFGYDAAAGEIAAASVGGEPNAPYVAIWLVDADAARGCFVLFEHAGAEPPELLSMTDEAEGVKHLGLVAPTSSPDWAILTSCTADQGFRLDPGGILGSDDAIAWAQARFSEVGVGVGAPGAEVDALLDETTGDERPWYGGGGHWLASAEGAAYEASAFTFAVEVDADMNILVEDGAYVPLLGDSYASGIVHGWFTVRPATWEPL